MEKKIIHARRTHAPYPGSGDCNYARIVCEEYKGPADQKGRYVYKCPLADSEIKIREESYWSGVTCPACLATRVNGSPEVKP